MKLKIDLHPIYNDTRKIEDSLQGIIDEAIRTRATLVEVIPGKGSGALKKSVLRFLDRSEIKSKYHRIEKDGDNWGRLFIHFRPEKPDGRMSPAVPTPTVSYRCFCCGVENVEDVDVEPVSGHTIAAECPSCGSPNKLTVRSSHGARHSIHVSPGYE